MQGYSGPSQEYPKGFYAQVRGHPHELSKVKDLALPVLGNRTTEVVVGGYSIDFQSIVISFCLYFFTPGRRHVQWISMGPFTVDLNSVESKFSGLRDHLIQGKGIAFVPYP